MHRYRISADIGGTFTDMVFYDLDNQEYSEGKVLTTPDNLSDAIISCIEEKINDYSEIEFFVHGTTVGLNAVLERRGAKVALITTKGFKDVYQLARGNRSDMYDLFFDRTKPLIKRRDTFEVDERILADGSEHTPVNMDSLMRTLEQIQDGGYQSIAVCLINSYINPKHELEIGRLINEKMDISVSLSCQIAQEWREYERTSTTVLNAYISPSVDKYLTSLEQQLQAKGFCGEIYIMQSGGGVISSKIAKQNPILTLLSGPVGGAIGNQTLSETQFKKNMIGVDMGGTSYDVSMIVDGRPDVSSETYLEGFPILIPMINIYTIGAGGGSIAWLEGGGLRVGPVSAGSRPGPACYGIGGNKATITDANLVLGRISEDGFLGGRMKLDREKSIQVMQELADELKLSVMETAEGICKIADSKMADAIRQLTVRKGIDPREFVLVAFGGAGPMHACNTADELDIKTVMVPNMPGIFSAWGMLQSDIRQDIGRTVKSCLRQVDRDGLASTISEMKMNIESNLAAQNIPSHRCEFKTVGEMRYLGQEYTLSIPFPGEKLDDKLIEEITADFHDAHQRIYGHNNKNGQIELVNIRLIGYGILEKSSYTPHKKKQNNLPEQIIITKAVFDGEEWNTAVYQREELDFGFFTKGPAIIEEMTATTVVPPEFNIYVDEKLNLILTKGVQV